MTTHPVTWVEAAAGSAYDVDNLPYAVFSTTDTAPRIGVRIGDHVLDLGAAATGLRPGWAPLLDAPALNPLMAAGAPVWAEVRAWVTGLLTDTAHRDRVRLVPLAEITLHLPFEVGDYVDYYASVDHATTVGRIFRPDGDALMPNWRHLPVAYHGRAGSIVVSGTPVHRPAG
ncbi:fumarylacetoacetase, partial [Streptomyces sp. DT225]